MTPDTRRALRAVADALMARAAEWTEANTRHPGRGFDERAAEDWTVAGLIGEVIAGEKPASALGLEAPAPVAR